jgi:membrane protease YdiL (CAAX protease family)
MQRPALLKRKAADGRSETEAQQQAKDLGSPQWVIFVTFLIFLLSQIVVAPLIVILGDVIFNGGGHLDLNNSVVAQFFFILAAELIAAWMAIQAVKRRHMTIAAMGLGRKPIIRDIGQAALGFVAFYLLLIISGLVINAFVPDITSEQQNLGFNNISTGVESTLAFISLVILPPLGEEILVRGYLFSGLRMVWRFLPAVIVTSLLFGAAHLEFGGGGPLVWAAAIDTFILSVVLCFLRERSGALYAGMIVHMLNNMIAFGVHFK